MLKRSKLLGAFSLLALGAVCLSGTAHAQAPIDTTGPWDGIEYITSWGIPDTSTYGQTFVVPTGASNLYSFSFWLTGLASPASTIPYRAYVAEWDTTNERLLGAPIWSSSQLDTAGIDDTGLFRVDYSTGGIPVTPGNLYVAFISTSGLQIGQPNQDYGMGWMNAGGYTDGSFVYFNTADDFGALSTSQWDSGHSGGNGTGDAAFVATFAPSSTAALEPGTLALAGIGLVGLAVKRRHK